LWKKKKNTHRGQKKTHALREDRGEDEGHRAWYGIPALELPPTPLYGYGVALEKDVSLSREEGLLLVVVGNTLGGYNQQFLRSWRS